jgi:hypothetical protein
MFFSGLSLDIKVFSAAATPEEEVRIRTVWSKSFFVAAA